MYAAFTRFILPKVYEHNYMFKGFVKFILHAIIMLISYTYKTRCYSHCVSVRIM